MAIAKSSPTTAIAVIGAACRFPGAADVRAYWQNLCNGLVSIRRLDDDELLTAGLAPERLQDPTLVKAGALIDGIEYFDAAFFGLMPREAELLDPQHRLFLEIAWSALEDAGYDPNRYRGSIGVFGGANFPSYLTANLLPAGVLERNADILQAILANEKDYLNTRVSYKLNLRGPSYTVQSGCSTSLLAIHLACQNLLNQECDIALAGGVSVDVLRARGYYFEEGGIASPDGSCRPFDACARGTVFGNGVGIVVLKRFEDAVADRDHIYASLTGSAVNNDGAAKAGFTTPSVSGQSQVIAQALANANVQPHSIDYVEAHGTGTSVGDPVEVRALERAFGGRREPHRDVAIGSVKANIGHLDSAAGVASFLKTVLALKHQLLPPTPGFKTPNPAIEFDATQFVVNTTLRHWPARAGEPRRAGVSSFGLGGTNVHVVLEEPPIPAALHKSRGWQLLVLSARSLEALQSQARNLLAHLEGTTSSLADIAFTLQVGRIEAPYRCYAVCRDVAQAKAALNRCATGESVVHHNVGHPAQIVFVLPGPAAGSEIAVANQLLASEPDFRLVYESLYKSVRDHPGTIPRVSPSRQVDDAGPFLLGYGLARLWQAWGVQPAACWAEGSGTYVAACLENVLAPEEAVRRLSIAAESTIAWPSQGMVAGVLNNSGCVMLELGTGSLVTRLTAQKVIENSLALACWPEAAADDSVLPTLLQAVGELWSAGISFDWEAFHRDRFPRRVSLPGYPFQRQRYWIQPERTKSKLPATSLPAPLPERLERRSADEWLYTPEWSPAELSGETRSWKKDTCWLLFEDALGMTSCFIDRLSSRLPWNHKFVRVTRAESYAVVSDGVYQMNPCRREDSIRLLNDVRRQCGRLPDIVIHFWSLDSKCADTQPVADEQQAALKLGFYSILWLLQAWERESGEPFELWVVGNGLHNVTGREVQCPARSALLGPCQVLPQENWRSRCRVLDLDLPLGETDNDRTLDESVDNLVAELLSKQEQSVVAYRDSRRWCLGYRLCSPRGTATGSIRQRGVYLVTGGLGNVGRTLSKYLAMAYQARLVLVGRSPLPPRDTWPQWRETHGDNDNTSLKLRDLEAMYAAGAELVLETADVCDCHQLSQVIQRARNRFGAIHGVIHAAGIMNDRTFQPISRLDSEDCERQFRVKVGSAQALEAALEDVPLDFCLVVSSLARVVGGFGYAAYAAAHHYLDSFVGQHNLQHGNSPWTCVNWEACAPEGNTAAGAEHSSQTEFEPPVPHLAQLALRPNESAQVLERVLQRPFAPHTVVSTVDLSSRIAGARGGWRLRRLQPNTLPSTSDEHSPAAWGTPLERALADIWRDVLGRRPNDETADFFQIGGDSLAAMQVISRVRQVFCVEPTVEDLFARPTLSRFASHIRTLQQHFVPTSTERIPYLTRQSDQTFPLSFAQQRLWFLNQLEPESAAYHVPMALELRGPLDLIAFERSLESIIARHEALRTRIEVRASNVVQVVAKEITTRLCMQEVTSAGALDEAALIRQKLVENIEQPFDLGRGELLRCTLLRVAEQRHVLLVVMHHMISDSWSMGVFAHEFAEYYEAIQEGRHARLSDLAIQYPDYASWQRDVRHMEILKQQSEYWERQLRRIPQLRLPTDHPRPPQQTFSGAAVSLRLSAELKGRLQALGESENATLFMSLLALLQLLLGRYANCEDLVVGCPIANRGFREVEGLIGCFVNNLVLRGDLSGNPSFREMLRRVRKTTLGAFLHQDMPFERVVELLQPDRNLNENPLFQVLFAMQAEPEPLDFHGLTVHSVDLDTTATRFDLELHAQPEGERVQITFIYNTDLFASATIERLVRHFENLLERVVADPAIPVNRISYLDDVETHQLLVDFNNSGSDSSDDVCLHELVERQVRQTPDAPAVNADDGQLTYAALDEYANRLAGLLRARGVSKGELIGVCVGRSWQLVANYLGVLKAGCAFVPLDPDWPAHRMAMVLGDSGASRVVTVSKFADSLGRSAEDVILHEQVIATETDNREQATIQTQSDDLAYVIYTSGSTGTPKGVEIAHRAVVNLLRACQREPGLTPADIWFSVTPPTFDISVMELFLPLTVGARIVIASRQAVTDVSVLTRGIGESGATLVQTTPTRWRAILDSGYQPATHLKILSGGEEMSRELAQDLLATGCEVWNLYGPTETTIWSTRQRMDTDRTSEVSLGRPIENTTVYILDRHLQPVPIGISGELYLGGCGLARGYRNHPGLTAERFIPNPFSGEIGSRFYRTGDRARWLPDGRIVFMGRWDDQVKVRGHRVELGEVESTLKRLPGIRDAVVLCRRERDSASLIAYVVTDAAQRPDTMEIRRQLSDRLPLAMIPSAYHHLDAFSRTPHGKIDRQALEAIPPVDPEFSEPQPPSKPLEAEVVTIWQELLQVREVGMHDNFFDLGGHSLLLLRLQQELETLTGIELAIADLFRYPTVALMSAFLASGGEHSSQSLQHRALSERALRQKRATRRRPR